MDNLKLEIKKQYENGATLKSLSEKYDIKLNTIKSWSSREGWKKKDKVATATKKATKEEKSQPEKNKKVSIGDKKQKAVEKVTKRLSTAIDLTEKEKLFCLYYIKDFNAALAVRKAGYNTTKHSDVMGYQMLQKEHIKKYINELREYMATDAMLDVNRLIEQYKKLAFYNIDDFVELRTVERVMKNDKGKVLRDSAGQPLTEEVEVLMLKPDYDGQLIGELSQMDNGSIKIKMPDRMKALDKLLDYVDIPKQLDRDRVAMEKQKIKTEEKKDTKIEISLRGVKVDESDK